MKTAMQELKSDLLTAIGTCNEALEKIKDLRTREACQAVVNLTIDNILNRIDTELLEMEKEQIIKHSLELAKILISNPYETSGKMPAELIDSYINKTSKSE
jgi:7-cyano-7-deazaguanine synthase in queuosine biosynthesis